MKPLTKRLIDFEKNHPAIEPYICEGTCEQCRKAGIFKWHWRARFFTRFGRICPAHVCDDCKNVARVIWMAKRNIYVNIGAEIWISTMLKILKEKGLIKEGELEEALAKSLKEYREGKFVKITIEDWIWFQSG